MLRTPENCGHRTVVETGERSATACSLLGRIAGIKDQSVCITQPDACAACCGSFRNPEDINPVIASLVYTLASRIVTSGGHPECSVTQAASLMKRAEDQLSVIVREIPEQNFPLSAANNRPPVPPTAERSIGTFQWAAAMLTAPRSEPAIEQSLISLTNAGFSDIHIFAEPEAFIPERFKHLKATRRSRRFGNFLNFYSCLTTLLSQQPDADAYAVFQDDIDVASGLRQWCEEQLWPQDCGVVSLFTPRLHSQRTSGWRICNPGPQRVCGAQALVFRRDLLQQFLSDPHVLYSLQLRVRGDDEVLGGWLARNGLGIAYHTPSLVQHTGKTSSIYPGQHDLRNLSNPVLSVDDIHDWKSRAVVPGRIGLVGWNSATGLGTINRDIACRLPIKQWLVPQHPWLSTLDFSTPNSVEITVSRTPSEDLKHWVSSLDWLLFAERPYLDSLPRQAAHSGVGVACIPMWEWIKPDLSWLPFVDVMICPTLHAHKLMIDWVQRYGFGWKTVYVPWPVDGNRFPFRQRTLCREFLFVNGWGGGLAHRPDGSQAPYQRKGMELIIAAARIAPDLKFVIRSQHQLPAGLPANIRIAPPLDDNAGLYEEGDVCVQPSHYEGLGLQLLECQAAGMPLITTAGPPMNEANPWRTIPTCGQEVINVGGGFISAELMTPESIVETLRPLAGSDIREPSRQSREYVQRERCWDDARRLILAELVRR